MGLSVILISLANGFNTDLFNYLFGSVSAVSRSDFYSIIAITVIVLTLIVLFYKELLTLSFDEEHAIVTGIHAKRIHFIFIFYYGARHRRFHPDRRSAPRFRAMTLPVASAMRLASSFKQLIAYSVLFAETSVITGLISGYYLDIPPGGTIVMVAVFILLITIGYKRLLARRIKGVEQS